MLELPRGRKNCTDMNTCVREEKKIACGERYELCRSVHAEANAIISASKNKPYCTVPANMDYCNNPRKTAANSSWLRFILSTVSVTPSTLYMAM